MKRKHSLWQRIALWIHGDGKRRCSQCKKQIKRDHRWHTVKGKPQHWNCNLASYRPGRRFLLVEGGEEE